MTTVPSRKRRRRTPSDSPPDHRSPLRSPSGCSRRRSRPHSRIISRASWHRSKCALDHRTSPKPCAHSRKSELRFFTEDEYSLSIARARINPAPENRTHESGFCNHQLEDCMRRSIVWSIAGVLATFATTAAAQMPTDSTHTMKRLGTPDSLTKRVSLEVKVDESVASSAKVSADAAEATAIAQVPEGGKVNSGEMHMEDGKLVYDINIVPNGKDTARLVRVDAMTGEIVKDKQYGGVKGVEKKHEQHEKEEKARKSPPDSVKKP